MKPVISPAEMRKAERRLFDTGVPSIDLMETAARALSDEIIAVLGEPEGKTVVYLCGCGGNGGDGFASARMLREAGARVLLVLTDASHAFTPDAIANFERVRAKAFHIIEPEQALSLPRPAMWVDAMYGIGFRGCLEDRLIPLVKRVEADRLAGIPVISADIPSGIDAETGVVSGACVTADKTVCFHSLKYGHVLADGPAYCGEIAVCDIGLDDRCSAALLIEKEDLKGALAKRRRHSHKNDYGHVLLIAGSLGMAGAAAMCANAALRSGAGLVTIACPREIIPILQVLVPHAMCVPVDDPETAFRGKTVIGIGPGLSMSADIGIVEAALRQPVPKVIDADALNLIAAHPELKALVHETDIITPHPGEAARLLGYFPADPAEDVKALPGTALLKGATTVIHTASRTYLSASGSPGMAKGGSGDTLTGILCALLAQGLPADRAACIGSELHGLAGEAAAKSFGEVSMLPSDLIACLPQVFSEYV